MAARDDMAAYMRARRARQRAEREAAQAAPSHMPVKLERAHPARDGAKVSRGVPVLTHDTLAGEGRYRDGNKPKQKDPNKTEGIEPAYLIARNMVCTAARRRAAPIHGRDRRKIRPRSGNSRL